MLTRSFCFMLLLGFLAAPSFAKTFNCEGALLVINDNLSRVAIDSIDQVSDNKLHCNEHGWFDYQGKPLDGQVGLLLKPSKATMTAACCGHQWRFSKRSTPRILSLREMLLASNINWRNLKRPVFIEK